MGNETVNDLLERLSSARVDAANRCLNTGTPKTNISSRRPLVRVGNRIESHTDVQL